MTTFDGLFRDARDALDGRVVRTRRSAIRDAGGVAAYLREKRAADRRELLDRLVPDRVCPACREIVVESRRWVVYLGLASCRGCWQRRKKKLLYK